MVILAPYQHKVGEEEVVIQAEEDALDLEKGGLIFGGKEYRLSGGVVLTHGSYRKGPKSTWCDFVFQAYVSYKPLFESFFFLRQVKRKEVPACEATRWW